ncbi:hypothetical protein [Pseudarthrobacter sp. BRE9]|uniref:hypothetical protein n=1 Tax=Pseudarthrobacter sp. BRE9 TaxID=2962582 RepID=UPI0028828BB4|nr:hypothetical protein [Pseudarthrobacter sp. BRE9]MDT0168088.1 hypothetical protein [Pseudarthrobacter sp. BRE9]
MTAIATRAHHGRGLKAAALAGLLVTAGAGTAYAYWTAGGTGSGSAAAGTMQTVTVDALVAGDNPRTALIPGGSADVVLRLTNPNPYAVQVYSITANGPATADAAHPGCTTTGVSFTGTTAPLSPATSVAANSSTLLTLPGSAVMDTTSLAACQGATFSLPVTAEVRK